MSDYISMLYPTHAAAGKAAVTIALAYQNDELSDVQYYEGMGEIVKHHPLALIYAARYAALALETAVAIQGRQTAQELWQTVSAQLDMEEDEE